MFQTRVVAEEKRDRHSQHEEWDVVMVQLMCRVGGSIDPSPFRHAPKRIQDSRACVMWLVSSSDTFHKDKNPLEFIPVHWLRDEGVVSTAVGLHWEWLGVLHHHFEDYSTYIGMGVWEANDDDDIDGVLTDNVIMSAFTCFVRQGMTNNILYCDLFMKLVFLRNLTRPDLLVRLMRVEIDILRIVSNYCESDMSWARVAFNENPMAVRYVDSAHDLVDLLGKDRALALKAVQFDGMLLKFCGNFAHIDAEIVRVALEKNSTSIRYAGLKFQDDQSMMRFAVNAGASMAHASDRLQSNSALMLHALRSCPKNTEYITEKLGTSTTFVRKAMDILQPPYVDTLCKHAVAAIYVECVMRIESLPEDVLRYMCQFFQRKPILTMETWINGTFTYNNPWQRRLRAPKGPDYDDEDEHTYPQFNNLRRREQSGEALLFAGMDDY